MEEERKISVRLAPAYNALLEKLSSEAGCDVSTIVRRGLDQLGASRMPGQLSASSTGERNNEDVSTATSAVIPPTPAPAPTVPAAPPTHREHSAGVAPTAGARLTHPAVPTRMPVAPHTPVSCPPTYDELVARCRHSGADVWKERKLRFQQTTAAAEAAQENNENARDRELFEELRRIGRKYNQLS